MAFAQHIDYPAGNTTLGGPYTAGSGSFLLATGTGSTFLGGASPSATSPVRFTVASATSSSTCTHYTCTGVSGDTLTGVAVFSGTDRNYNAGDTAYSSVYKEDLTAIETAVSSLQSGQAGMFWSVADAAARDAIPSASRVEGMQVFTQSDEVYWSLLPPPWTGTGTDWIQSAPLVVEHNGTAIGSRGTINLIDGANVTLTVADNPTSDRVDVTVASTAGGSGTVTSVSVVSANGFAGTVATATTTPAITLTTTASGLLKGDGTAISPAVAGTDYVVPSGSITGTAANVTGTVAVANGGTGETTLTAHAVLLGEGTAGVGFATIGTSGRILIDQGAAADPAFVGMSGDASITGAGAITVAKIGGKSVSLGGSLTTSGAFSLTLTTTAATSLTLPTSGTLVNTSVAALSSLASIGTITTGTWQGTPVGAAYGGTGQSSYSTGDLLYAGGATAISRLAGNTSATREFLTSTGTGTAANAPAWSAIAAADLPVFVASGASHAPGAVPDPGATAGTTRYLREDATWATPAGGGGSPGGSSGQLQYNSAGAFGGAANLTVGSSGQLNFAAQASPASPANGDQWHDSTQHAQAYRQSGLTIYRPGLVYSQTASTTATAVAATSLVSTTGALGTVSLPAAFLNVAGRTLRLRAGGYGSTGTSAVGNLGLGIFLGAVAVGSNGNEVLNTNQTSTPWYLEATVTTVATGASGTLQVAGAVTGKNPSASLWSPAQTTNVANSSAAFLTTPQTPVSIDLTAAYTLDLQANLTATGNTITLTSLVVEVLG